MSELLRGQSTTYLSTIYLYISISLPPEQIHKWLLIIRLCEPGYSLKVLFECLSQRMRCGFLNPGCSKHQVKQRQIWSHENNRIGDNTEGKKLATTKWSLFPRKYTRWWFSTTAPKRAKTKHSIRFEVFVVVDIFSILHQPNTARLACSSWPILFSLVDLCTLCFNCTEWAVYYSAHQKALIPAFSVFKEWSEYILALVKPQLTTKPCFFPSQ